MIDFIENPDLAHVIIRGEGKHFCSGADIGSLKELAREPQILQKALDQGKELLEVISNATIPVAALILGSCLGGGLELALSCHFRFASNNAMFGFPESELGLMPGLGGTLLSKDLIPRHHLIDLVLSGRMIRGEEAKAMGIVHTVCPTKQVEKELVTFLTQLTEKHPPRLIRSVMQSIHNSRRLSTSKALTEESRLFCELARELPSSV